ncbi:hypothetical protein NM688_g1123 [Phlebia brevispora]|uniref:Uncharacterized protein n=1 Tax=Phlebia brevispora TaxID=194682 RepID=A0ACC1TC32_9APHY|nr:hypothetical protein NM688_g1123 [Phlebia brevispora]
MSDIVIGEITPEVVTFSKPFSRIFGLFPMGGRSTAIKLSTGGVWVLASTPLSKETKERVDALGPVHYILAASADHHFFLSEWKKAYPTAKVIGVQGLAQKKKSENWKFDGAYGVDAAETIYGFEADILAWLATPIPADHDRSADRPVPSADPHCSYFSGFSKKDVAWLHVPSRTLIVADLIFNLPAVEQYSKTSASPSVRPPISWLLPKFEPYATSFQKFLWNQGKDKEAMRRDAKKVSEWEFDRIIPCHGDVIETDAKKAWTTAFARYLH